MLLIHIRMKFLEPGFQFGVTMQKRLRSRSLSRVPLEPFHKVGKASANANDHDHEDDHADGIEFGFAHGISGKPA